jgi:hypothetical protein
MRAWTKTRPLKLSNRYRERSLTVQQSNLTTGPTNTKAKSEEQFMRDSTWLRDEPLRAEVEKDWEMADKEYAMDFGEIDPNDWRSHLELTGFLRCYPSPDAGDYRTEG